MCTNRRELELWHIPKRGNVHQCIFMLKIINDENINGRIWNTGKQELIASKLGIAGLTNSGHALSHQSIRTLLANLPKYLGFTYIDSNANSKRIYITEVGRELINYHNNISDIPIQRNLREYENQNRLILTSPLFKKQLAKLIITNPTIKEDCINILVFPFRFTLRLLLELEYLDKEELAYIVFRTASEDEYPLVLQRLRNFRAMPAEQRTAEISAFSQTKVGNLTLVKAPTSIYFMYLCLSTGLCVKTTVTVNRTQEQCLPAIKLINEDNVRQLLNEFESARIFNFGDNWYLWKEYFTNPNRLYPPHMVRITSNATDILIIIYKNEELYESGYLNENNLEFNVPFFRNEIYKILVYDFNSGAEIQNQNFEFNIEDTELLLDINITNPPMTFNKREIGNNILEMFTNNYGGFDMNYHNRLILLSNILGKNFLDNPRKGGRLEFLFFKLLSILESENIIIELIWFGRVAEYGLALPAPAGRMGNPDITFRIGNNYYILELTTFRGTRAQWQSSEAASVPDHFRRMKRENPQDNIIGIFSAPSIHEQLKNNLLLNAREDNYNLICISCNDLIELILRVNPENVKDEFSLLYE